ncbi:MAG: hypothetical protein OEW39_09975 [Deltaproteobacteria bacterium]|nr:hypothetical protein [Deltaproteobacteria bacterium]
MITRKPLLDYRSLGIQALVMLLMLWGLVTPVRAQGESGELVLWRNLFPPPAGTGLRETRELTPGTPVVVESEIWRVRGVSRLQVRSPDPGVGVVMRFRLAPALPAESAKHLVPLESPPGQEAPDSPLPEPKPNPLQARLILVLIAEPGPVNYQYKAQGEAVEAGARVSREHYTVGRGAETGLVEKGDPIRQVEIQDDGRAELRTHQEGELLVIEVVPPAYGGTPTAGIRPFYEGRNLTYADAALMLGGYRNTVLGDLRLLEGAVLRVNALRDPGVREALAARVLASAQVWRATRWSLWLDGGAGYAYLREGNARVPSEPTWTAGATVHFRQGPWGAALHYATLDGQGLMSLHAGWQFSRRFGAGLFWHSYAGLGAPGLSASLEF